MAGQNNIDLFYPAVLDPFKQLDPTKVDDAIRRAYDLIYKISPPISSTTTSSVLTDGFVDGLLVKLSALMLILTHEVFTATTSAVYWNSHQLDYNGIQYTIAAGSGTGQFVIWSKSSPNTYTTSATLPTLAEDTYVVAIYTAATPVVQEVWQARWRQAGTGTSVTGAGTTNYVTKWSNGPSGILADSSITDSGTNVAFTALGSITNNAVPYLNSSKQIKIDEGNLNWDSTNHNFYVGFGPLTDLVSGGGCILATGSGGFITATANSNASTGAFNVVAGSYVSINAGKTGSGTRLPLVFFTGGAEAVRFDTSKDVTVANLATSGNSPVIYATSAGKLQQDGGNIHYDSVNHNFYTGFGPLTDLVSGGGCILASGSGGFIVATANSNASTGAFNIVSSSYVSINAGRTGSGTKLPLAFFTGGAETARFDVTNNFLVGLTTADDTTRDVVTAFRSQNDSARIFVRNDSTGTIAESAFVARAGAALTTNAIEVGITGSGFSTVVGLSALQGHIITAAGATAGLVINTHAGPIIFDVNTATGVETARFDTSGDLTITNLASSIAPVIYATTAGKLQQNGGQFNWDNTNHNLYVGFGPLTDLVSGGGCILASGSGGFIAATANSDASTGAFNVVAGSYVSINAGRTGAGTRLPLAFFTGGAESGRFETGGDLLLVQNPKFKSGTAFIGTLDHAIAADRTWTFPDTTGTVLLSTGTGTTNKLAKFSGAATLADSSISDDGSNVVIGDLPSITNAAPLFANSSKQIKTDEGNLSWDSVNHNFYVGFGPLSDLVSGGGCILASGSGGLGVSTANSNASTLFINIVAGTYASLNAGRTGAGTRLPLVFFTGGAESGRYETGGDLLLAQNPKFKSGTAFTGTLDHAIAADRTWTFPDATGNLLISTGSGTTNTISKFSGSATLADSSITDDGSNVTIGDLPSITSSAPLFANSSKQLKTNEGYFSWDNTNHNLYVGFGPLTDLVSGGGCILASGSGGFGVSTANSNASTMFINIVAGTYASFNAGKTGSGTRLDMVFFTGGAEAVRFDTSKDVTIANLATSSNSSVIYATSAGKLQQDGGNLHYDATNKNLYVGFGPLTGFSGTGGMLATGDAGFTAATANSNASTFNLGCVAGTYASLNAGRTGAGTRLPLAMFTGGAETMRLHTSNNVSIGSTTDNGYKLEVTGTLNVTGAVTGNSFTGAGSGITTLNANNIALGTLAIAHGGTNTTSFTSGSIPYYDGSKLNESNSHLFWDSANTRLLMGITSSDVSTNNGIVMTNSLVMVDAATNAVVLSVGKGASNWVFRSTKTGSATAVAMDFMVSSTINIEVDGTSNATNTCMLLMSNGSLRRVAIWNDGTRDLLYLV